MTDFFACQFLCCLGESTPKHRKVQVQDKFQRHLMQCDPDAGKQRLQLRGRPDGPREERQSSLGVRHCMSSPRQP